MIYSSDTVNNMCNLSLSPLYHIPPFQYFTLLKAVLTCICTIRNCCQKLSMSCWTVPTSITYKAILQRHRYLLLVSIF